MRNYHPEVVCLLCGSIAELVEKDLPGYKEPDKFNIYHCKKCDTSFSLPRIEDQSEIYDLIYKNIKIIPTYYRYWHYAEVILKQERPFDYLAGQEEAYWSIKQALDRETKEPSVSLVLEIGCGLGYLSYSLNKAGYKCTGIDISSESINYAKSKYGSFYECADIKQYALNNTGKYDIVIMTEVLEHIHDIKAFLIEAKKLLKSNGRIILTTPDKSPFKGYSNWFTELPPIHSWWFSESSLKKCAELLNMDVDFIDFRDFYKSPGRSRIINLKKLTKEKPTLDNNGNFISQQNSGETIIPGNKSLLLFFRKITGTRVYNFLRVLFYSNKKNYIVLGRQGYSICAVLCN